LTTSLCGWISSDGDLVADAEGREDGSYILYNYSGGFSWYLFRPDNRLQYDIAGTLGNWAWG
jgi:hypothetical protein